MPEVSATLRRWLIPPRPDTPETISDPALRRAIGIEIAIVLSTTLGLNGLHALLSLVDSLLRPQPLSQQTVAINVPRATQTLLDLAYQLTNVLQLVAWGGLGCYLLWRAGIRLGAIGLDRTQPGRDAVRALGLAAMIGIPGLVFYLVGRALDYNLNVMPSTLGDNWWRAPVLILAAIGNAWAEEVIVVGYLITRLRGLGWGENWSLLASSVLRGSYHLYQGPGGFVGNVLMGLVFGRTWQRTNRLWALVGAHSLIDTVAFVGYSLLRGHISWLP